MDARLCAIFVLTGVASLFALLSRGSRTTPLRATPPGLPSLSSEDTEHLDQDLQGLLGHGASRERLARIEGEMRPTFATLPKTGDDTVNQAAASYALHRYFASSKAWVFKGLAPPKKGSAAATSAVNALKSQVPDVIADLLEMHVGSKLIGLADLAVLAATLEDLVHGGAVDVLHKAYRINDLPISETLDHEQRELVMEAFCYYIMGGIPGKKKVSVDEATREQIASAATTNTFLKDLTWWATDVMGMIQHQTRTQRPFANTSDLWDFASMVHWSEQFMLGIGHIQDMECRSMKAKLLELEDGEEDSKGTIAADTFYSKHLQKLGLRPEQTVPYLRFLAALGGQAQGNAHAVVPNYVYASPMCLATPSVLALCCINECNPLMDALERRVARPAAAPQLIAAAVSSLPSNSVPAPRNLSDALLRGLDKIADQHGGQVPLHSKAFALWMYRAFPLECPNPAVEGATHAPWVGEAFVQSVESTGSFMSVKVEKLHAYDASSDGDDDDEACSAEDGAAAAAATEKRDAATEGLGEAGYEGGEEELRPLVEEPTKQSSWTSNFFFVMRILALTGVVVGSGLTIVGHLRFLAEAWDSNSKLASLRTDLMI